MLKKFLQIASGPIFGQGTFFLLTVYLASTGDIKFVADVSIGMGILSLIQWCADGGGVFLLGRYQEKGILKSALGSIVSSRCVYSLIVYLGLLLLLPLFYENKFVHELIKYALPVCIFGSFSLTGLVDYLGKNRIVGPLASLSWILVVLYILYCIYDVSEVSAVAVSLLYTIGFIIYLLLQYIVCRRYVSISRVCNSFDDFFVIFKETGGYFISYFASQAYARLLPIVVDIYLGRTTAGYFAIAKMFLNIFSQMLLFLRRVENNRIIEITRENNVMTPLSERFRKLLSLSFKTSKYLLLLSFISTGILITAVFIHPSLSRQFIVITFYISITIGGMVFWNYSSILGQSFIITGNTTKYATVIVSSLSINLLINLLLFPIFHIWSIVIAETIMYIIQIFSYYYLGKENWRGKEYDY